MKVHLVETQPVSEHASYHHGLHFTQTSITQ